MCKYFMLHLCVLLHYIYSVVIVKILSTCQYRELISATFTVCVDEVNNKLLGNTPLSLFNAHFFTLDRLSGKPEVDRT